MLYRLLCTYAPSQLMLVAVAGVGTFIWGLQFVAIFLTAVAVGRVGYALDHYGLRKHDT